MVFSSYIFLFVFLPITTFIYFVISKKYKNIWLLVSSLIFYGWSGPKYILILIISIFTNWIGAYLIEKIVEKYRKAVLFFTLFINIALLAYFKYTNFIIDNINKIVGNEKNWTQIAFPLGISFFTFQGISYVIDVYRKDGEALHNPLDVGLYISFFPKLVSGPIVRFKNIALEIRERTSNFESIGYGFRRFIYGLAKKVIIANTFGVIADTVFNSNSIMFETSWVGAIAYTLQIYYDFSGYSDMAIGLGSIFGFHFGENFNYPYISKSITEFWRRWHISLSTWFRDYVYIPLGGNRVKPYRHIINMFIVWLLTGIWHGANWTFIFWGLYYGILLVGEKYLIPDKIEQVIPKSIRWFITIFFVIIGWVLFRSNSLVDAFVYLKNMFGFQTSDVGKSAFMRLLINYKMFWVIGIIGAFPIKNIWRKVKNEKVKSTILMDILENLYIAVIAVISFIFLVSSSYDAFIYFQF